MRWLSFWVLLITASSWMPAAAQDTGPENVVREFSGSGTTTTGLFKIQDRWEVRWNARRVVSVAVMSSDGVIVAGAAGVLRGSLFVPLGGQYYLKISDGTAPAPPAGTNAPAIISTTNAPSAGPPPAATDSSASSPPEPVVSWHLQVVELGASVASDQALTVYTPYFMVPDSAVTPVAMPVELPPPVLTNEQAQTVVTIKGDAAQGSGFLMRSPEGTFVVTRLYLLAANPNIKIFTNTGAQITPTALKAALDRGLAMYSIQDDHYQYLPAPTDANGIDSGDQEIIPNIGAQTDVLLGKPGRIIGMSPERIDFDNVMGPGSSGAPVIHVKSGHVIAMVVPEKRVDVSDTLAKAWPANPAPGAEGIFPYYGLRLTGVQGWQTYDADRFLAESLFLKQFHRDTRCLDSFLNGRRRREAGGSADDGPPDNQFFLTNAKLRAAYDTYRQFAAGADRDQRLDAARELLSDLEGVADADVGTLQEMNHLYAYDQAWAREELAYRKAIKSELDNLGSNIVQLDTVARSH